jgi:hypothetical protein
MLRFYRAKPEWIVQQADLRRTARWSHYFGKPARAVRRLIHLDEPRALKPLEVTHEWTSKLTQTSPKYAPAFANVPRAYRRTRLKAIQLWMA